VRVATFNVLHGRAITNGRPAEVSPAALAAGRPLAEAVAALDADVLALQELDRFQDRSGACDQALVAARALGATDWRYASALHGRPAPRTGWVREPAAPDLGVHGPRGAEGADGLPSHGIALLTRLPVRYWRAWRFAPAPMHLPLRVPGRPGLIAVRDQPRAALAAVLDTARGPLTVAAVHLSFVPGWNAGQLVSLQRWLTGLPRPRLLLGDLNLIGALPRVVLNAAQATARSTGGPGWHDLARAATYPAHRPMVQFDHVLAAGIPRDAVRAVRTPGTAISDHRPIVADISW